MALVFKQDNNNNNQMFFQITKAIRALSLRCFTRRHTQVFSLIFIVLYSFVSFSVGRALHRYRRGHGFKSCTGLNFFSGPIFSYLFSGVLSCEDLLNSFNSSPQCKYMNSIYLKSLYLSVTNQDQYALWYTKRLKLILGMAFTLT